MKAMKQLHKFKRIEMVQCMVTSHSGMTLDVKTWKLTNLRKLINTLLNNKWVKEEEIKRNQKIL